MEGTVEGDDAEFLRLTFADQYLRAIFTAPSFASAPELQKKARSAKE